MGRLSGKVALVTGAANGIGKATAKCLAENGAQVVCTDLLLDPDPSTFNLIASPQPLVIPKRYGTTLNHVVADIAAAGHSAIGIQADISDESSIEHLLRQTKARFGSVDILVNVAVLTYFMPTVEMPIECWDRAFAVMVRGPFILSKKVLPVMIERRRGAIININSMAAIGPGRGPYAHISGYVNDAVPMYGAAKAAVERFTQGLAREVSAHGITVAAVAPSVTVKTEGGDELGLRRDHWEPVEMMAQAILLLASEPMEKVTGRVTYSQAILKEFGWIDRGEGAGIDFPGSGYSQI